MSATRESAGSPPRGSARALALDLRRVLDEIVFNIEHGIPSRFVEELERISGDLERLPGHTPRLRTEIAAFRNDLHELFTRTDAPDRVLDRGQHIVATLLENDVTDSSAERPARRD